MEQFFDRRIDLRFYNESGKFLASISTPDIGQKPDITIKGTLISESSAISTDITVVNLERGFEVDSVAWIYAVMSYGRMRKEGNYTSMLFYVQYADQVKGPPDRQVVFKCIQASSSPDIMGGRIKLSHLEDKKAVGVPLHKFLAEFIEKLNDVFAITTTNDVKLLLKLNPEPSWEGTEDAKELEVFPGSQELTVYQWFTWLNSQVLYKEPSSLTNKVPRQFYGLHFFIRESKELVVQPTPTYNETNTRNGKSVVELTHVLSVYRNGNIIHVRTLFDPRIHQGTYLHISAFNIGGKRSLGKIVPLDKLDYVYFTPVGGIPFEFGTRQGNSMALQGVVERDQKVEGPELQ